MVFVTSSGGSGLLMLDQLRQFTSDSVSDVTHHELFTRLYHVMLDYRMKENVFSRVCVVCVYLFPKSLHYVVSRDCFHQLKIMFWRSTVNAMVFVQFSSTWLPSRS